MEDDGWTTFRDFGSDEPGFAQGFEIGRLWHMLGQVTSLPYKSFVHSVSPEQLNRLCDAYSCEASWDHLGEGWLEVTFKARNPEGQTS